jgi:hypothetical protein
MLRYSVNASLIPDDAYTRRGGGGGTVAVVTDFTRVASVLPACMPDALRCRTVSWRVYRYAGGVRPSHPIADRPGRPIAGRPGRSIAGYPGYGRGYYRRGLGYGAAAVGAAAAAGAYGAYGYHGNDGCCCDNNGSRTVRSRVRISMDIDTDGRRWPFRRP